MEAPPARSSRSAACALILGALLLGLVIKNTVQSGSYSGESRAYLKSIGRSDLTTTDADTVKAAQAEAEKKVSGSLRRARAGGGAGTLTTNAMDPQVKQLYADVDTLKAEVSTLKERVANLTAAPPPHSG